MKLEVTLKVPLSIEIITIDLRDLWHTQDSWEQLSEQAKNDLILDYAKTNVECPCWEIDNKLTINL